ncbi:MAG: hypothetical protein HY678_00480, partial [Chloroflexi bacterium]|nr:hypothetical protein [Chloroflexota bacterium]
ALILALYVGALVVLRSVGADKFSESTLNLSLVIALLAGVPLVPQVRSGVSLLVDRLLYRDFVDHQGVIREVSINAVRTTDVGGINHGILDRVAYALGLTYTAYVEFGADKAMVIANARSVPDSIAVKAMSIQSEGKADAARPVLVDSGLEVGQALCATVPGREQQIGYLFLGPKESGEPFNSEDVQLAQTVASLLSTVAARIRLLDELRAQSIELGKLNVRLVEVEEQQLARLSAYLHDEPLQKVTYVLGQYRDRYSDDQLAKILLDVTNDLRLVSGTLSPAILVDLGLVRALEALVRDTESRAKFQVEFQVSGIGREQRLPMGVELTAYRVAQEALANCQKHSKATAVWMELAVSMDTLVLSVDDNGVGINGAMSEPERASTHLGLRHLKQRVESYGGSLTVANRRSRGASLVATIPVTREISDAGSEFRIHAN